jgi:hypothetical protein
MPSGHWYHDPSYSMLKGNGQAVAVRVPVARPLGKMKG